MLGNCAVNLRQLEIFGAVMSTGTTVGAANMLNVSQPAVSQMILHMEDQLKFKLFHRLRGRLVPTQEANLLYERAKRVFEAFDSTNFVVEQIKGNLIGELRLVCTPALGNAVLPLAIARFRKPRPEVKVSLELGSLDYVSNSVETGRADLGVHYVPDEHPLFQRVKLGDVSMVCVLPKDHPLATKRVIEPTDLADQPFISVSPADPIGAVIRNAFKQANIDLELAVEVRYHYTSRDLVALNQGIALVESYLLLSAHRYPELVFRTFRPQIVTTAEAVYLKNRPLGAIAQLFLEDLRATCDNILEHEEARVHLS